jgi:hypothetical protein
VSSISPGSATLLNSTVFYCLWTQRLWVYQKGGLIPSWKVSGSNFNFRGIGVFNLPIPAHLFDLHLQTLTLWIVSCIIIHLSDKWPVNLISMQGTFCFLMYLFYEILCLIL